MVPNKKQAGAKGAKKNAGRKGGGAQSRKGKATAKSKTKNATKSRAKSSPKPRPGRGATQKARERAEGLIDPNVHVVTKDPLRIQILSVAIQRPFSPGEFAEEAEIPVNVAAYHFKVLRDHGFLELTDLVKVRGRYKHMYRATKSGFISDADWGEVSGALRPGVAGQILQDFNGRLTQAIETGTLFTRDDACLFWAPRDLDEIAWQEHVSMSAWTIEESERLGVETVERRANGESHGSFLVTFAIAVFPSPTHEEVKAKEREKRKRKAPTAKGNAKAKAKAKGTTAKGERVTKAKGRRAHE